MADVAGPLAPPRAAWLARRRARDRLFKAGVIALIVPGALLFLAPFFWMVSTSLKQGTLVYVFPPQIIPDPIVWSNYPRAMTRLPFHLYALNTLEITGLAMVGQLLTASLCAFGFARMRFPGRDAWFLVLLSTIMLPGQVTLVPTFVIFRLLGWVDTYYPLIVPYWFGGTAFSIFLLRQFIATVPLELDDAAKIDGCSYLGIYWRIILPQITPALAAVGIFSFLQHWNDFFHPVIYLNSRANWTLSLALNFLRRADDGGGFNANLELLMAATLLVMLPPLLLFFLAQKYFIQGIVFTGVKGYLVLETMRLPQRQRGTVADEAVPRIVELILEAGLRPGDRLPSERELMARLAVGRSSLREAVKTLVALGVIEVAVGSGMYVADGEGSMITRPLFWGRLMSEQSTRDVVEARRVVEVELAGMAAERAHEDELAAIREKVALIERHLDDPDAFARYDLEFHLAIADAAHNQVLRQVIDTMRHVMRVWFAEAFRGREDRSEPVGRHQVIYDAIAARDPARARQAMAEHIEGGTRWLFEAIERGGRGKGSQ